MNQSDESTRNHGDQISQAEPYRTPADVADTPASRGMFQSPIAWIVSIGAVVAVGAFLGLTAVRTQTREFGGDSRVPVEEIMEYEAMVEYEHQMSDANQAEGE